MAEQTKPTWITVCDTCKREGWENGDMSLTDGERLADAIEALGNGSTSGGVRIRRHSCLMGCAHGCNVTIQAAGKLTYTIGNFEPTEEAAEGIWGYACLHSESASGQVPYRQWPQAIKGHFVTRHPPLPED